MKHKLRTILLVLVLMFTFILNVNAETKIKEDANAYTGDVYIIGSSKFDSNIIVTGTMATVAGAREAYIQYMINYNYDFSPEDVKIYYYSELAETWSVLPATSEDEIKELTEKETKELTDNLNIYYVNEVEKTIEVPYDVILQDGFELTFYSDNEKNDSKITYEDGKIKLPATVKWLEVYAEKETGEETEELFLGSVSQNEGEFKNDYNVVRTYEELLLALESDTPYIQIDESIDMPTALEISREVEIHVSEGIELTISKDKAGDGVFHVVEGGILTISGNGTIDGCGDNKYNIVVFADGGNVIINGGKFTNKNLVVKEDDTDADHFDVIYAKGNSQVEIYGGYFEGKTPAWLLNLKDENRETASIKVYGGEFEGFNPANNEAEGKNTNFLAKTSKVHAYNGIYTVSELTESDVAMVNYEAYASLGDAFAHAPAGSTITLLKNVDLNSKVVVDKEVTFDLNGYDLTITEDEIGDGVFHVVTGGKLTINGEGTIDGVGKSEYTMAIWADGGEVIINGGTYTNVGSGDDNQYDLIYAKNGGKITINGGYFTSQTPKWTLNAHDKTLSTIEVKGGTFVNYNPGEVYTEPTQPKSFLAEGYKVVETNGEFTVVAYDAENVTDEKELSSFLKKGESVKIGSDIELTKGFVINKEVTLNLNGKTLYASENQKDIALMYVATDGKLTITGNGTINAASQGNDYSMAIWAYSGGEVIIENGTFTNLGGKSTEDDGDPNNNELIYTTDGGKVTINGGRFIGNSENEKHGTKYTLNLLDNSKSEITVKGGTFVDYNPADAHSEPTQPLSFVAEGYKVVENKDTNEYTVVAE